MSTLIIRNSDQTMGVFTTDSLQSKIHKFVSYSVAVDISFNFHFVTIYFILLHPQFDIGNNGIM
jgi:hypothetical protein